MADARVINFMGMRGVASAISVILLVLSLGSLAFQGLKYGLDFTGGTQIEVSFSQPADLDQVRNLLTLEGYDNYEVVYFGSETEVLIRIQDTAGEDVDPETAASTGDSVVDLLRESVDANVELQRSEYVGAIVGEQLREQGGLGLLVSLGIMLIYIALRFQYKFGVATVAALAEDVIITLGFFSLFRLDFDLNVLAALMAVIGYGLNDTIVICDRIRENFRVMRKAPAEQILNFSLTQTLSRTIVTSGTTLMVLISLLLLGGETLRGFAAALIVGVVIGTYSSIFVATNVLIRMKVSKEDLMPPAREEADELP